MFKKAVKYALAGSLALGIIFGAGSISTYAEVTPTETTTEEEPKAPEPTKAPVVTLDYFTQSLEVVVASETGASKVPEFIEGDISKYVNIAVYKKDAQKYTFDRLPVKIRSEKVVKSEESSTYNVEYYVSVNVGFYTSPTVEYEVQVYTGDSTKPVKLTINKQTRALVAKYDPKAGTLKVTADGNDLKNLTPEEIEKGEETCAYEVKTLYGTEWISGEYVDFSSYGLYGATLCVRQKAVEDMPADSSSSTPAVAGKPASKEVKVKIPKQAAAPKASFNPSAMTVTIPKGAQWRIVSDLLRTDNKAKNSYILTAITASNEEGWMTVSDGKPQALADIQKKVNEAGAQAEYVKLNPKYKPVGERVGATETAKEETYGRYIGDSTINTVQITESESPVVLKATDDITKAAVEAQDVDLLYLGATIELKVPATEKKTETKISSFDILKQSDVVDLSKVNVEYLLDKKEEKVVSVKLTNNSGVDLQFVIGEQATAVKDLKFATVKNGASKTYPAAQAANTKKILVRIAGTTATKDKAMVWASKISEITIKHPALATELTSINIVAAGSNKTGKSNVTLGALREGYTYGYVTGSEEPKKPVLKEKKSGGTALDFADGSMAIEATFTKDQWVAVYEYDSDNIITGYKFIKVTEPMIQ